MKIAQVLGRTLLVLALVLWLAWTALTIVFSNLQPAGLRQGLALVYVIGLIGALVWLRPRRRGLIAVLAAGALVTLAYLLTFPSNDRDWLPDVAVAPTAEIDGSRVTVHGVRIFRYRSDADFDAVWEDRTYDLDRLRTLDLFMSYWGPVDYCHTIVSFGFEGGEQLAVSVEVRKEKGETYSTFGGFFKMFELCYVFADERDVIGVRASHRGEDVHLYRLKADRTRLRELLLSYLRFANELAARPQFYDVIENSCGVNILHRIAETGSVHLAGKAALLNGYWDEILYERGGIDWSLPFEELRERSRISAKAIAAGDSPAFSVKIREGLPPAPPADPSGAVAR